jgi:hypothetical protein
MLKALGVVFLVLIGIGVVASQVKKNDERAAVDNATDPGRFVDVSSDRLHDAYKENEVAADNAYRGKVLRVTGAVQEIRKDISDTPIVELWTSNEFEPVSAYFENEGDLASLHRGEHVAIRCIGDNVVMGSPQLKMCRLDGGF